MWYLSPGKAFSRLATPTVLASTVVVVIAAAGVYFSLVSAPGPIGVLGAGLALIMLAIAVIDLRSFIIPDVLNAAAALLAIMHAAAQEPEAGRKAGGVAGGGGALPARPFFGRPPCV